jgi:hypothetical protein
VARGPFKKRKKWMVKKKDMKKSGRAEEKIRING